MAGFAAPRAFVSSGSAVAFDATSAPADAVVFADLLAADRRNAVLEVGAAV